MPACPSARTAAPSILHANVTVGPDGHLLFAGADTVELAKRYGTPLMLLDEGRVRERCRTYREAMADHFPEGSLPLYASKALSFREIYRIVEDEGLGVDVVSPGEIATAASAGFPLERAFFHGNNKTDADIRYAMDEGVGTFVVDNLEELRAVEAEAARRGRTQRILLRITPGIDPHTHVKITTGTVDSKFGSAIETGAALAIAREAIAQPHIELCGFHCHVGSQIASAEPFLEAARIMVAFAAEVKDALGFETRELNLGGGFGVRYTEADLEVNIAANIRELGACLADACAEAGLRPPQVFLEPGRSIVADAGMTLYTVGSVKEIPGFRNYVSIDGGMTDNPRYTLYQSEYTVVLANRADEPAEFACTVGGRCCESGDLIGEGLAIARPRRGDLLAVLVTGAYNYSMASNYNRICRPPIVIIRDGEARLGVRRETFDDLLACDC